jgi:hypothetical protein
MLDLVNDFCFGEFGAGRSLSIGVAGRGCVTWSEGTSSTHVGAVRIKISGRWDVLLSSFLLHGRGDLLRFPSIHLVHILLLKSSVLCLFGFFFFLEYFLKFCLLLSYLLIFLSLSFFFFLLFLLFESFLFCNLLLKVIRELLFNVIGFCLLIGSVEPDCQAAASDWSAWGEDTLPVSAHGGRSVVVILSLRRRHGVVDLMGRLKLLLRRRHELLLLRRWIGRRKSSSSHFELIVKELHLLLLRGSRGWHIMPVRHDWRLELILRVVASSLRNVGIRYLRTSPILGWRLQLRRGLVGLSPLGTS